MASSILNCSRLASSGVLSPSQGITRKHATASRRVPGVLQSRSLLKQRQRGAGWAAAAYRGDEERGGRPHDSPSYGEGPKVPAEPFPDTDRMINRNDAERAGRRVEGAANDAGRRVEGAANDAGRKLKDAAEEVGGESGMVSRIGYLVLTAAALFVSVTAWTNPTRALSFLLGDVSTAANAGPLHYLLGRLLASVVAAVAFVDLALFKAAQMDKLGSPEVLRLNRGLMLSAFTGLAILYGTAAPFTSRAVSLGAAYLGAHAFLALKNGGKGLLNPSELLGSAFIGVGNTLAVRTPRDIPLSLLTAGLGLASVGYLLAPTTTLTAFFGETGGAVGVALARLLGSGLLVLPFATYDQKDMWDRQVHNRQTLGAMFKILSLGLGLAAWGHVSAVLPVLRAGAGGPFLAALAAAWGVGLLSSIQNFVAA